MPKAIKIFVHAVDATNKFVGTITMYLVFAMIGLLLYEPISRTIFDRPLIWSMEVAQFTMAAYWLLGGGYSMILRGHVRMDLLYGRWSEKKKATVDAITDLFLIFYLVDRRPADAFAGDSDIFQGPGNGDRGEDIA